MIVVRDAEFRSRKDGVLHVGLITEQGMIDFAIPFHIGRRLAAWADTSREITLRDGDGNVTVLAPGESAA